MKRPTAKGLTKGSVPLFWCDEQSGQYGPWTKDGPREGYDKFDPMIGMGADSVCSNFDRQYMDDPARKKAYGTNCRALSDSLSDCIKRRIKKDSGKKAFGKYNLCTNNCQEYADDIIQDCKREAKRGQKSKR